MRLRPHDIKAAGCYAKAAFTLEWDSRSAADPKLHGAQLSKMNTRNCSSSIRFRLAISVEEYLAYYQGSAQVVLAYSEDNKTIRFPASAIRKFVTNDGIFGDFEITFDQNNKLIAIESID